MARKRKSDEPLPGQLSLPLGHNGGPALDDKFRVSQSKVKTYRRCRRAYHYKYVEKIKPKRKSRALTFGSLVHQMIERHAEGDDPMEVLDNIDVATMRLFASEKAEYGEIIEDTRRIMTEYFEHWDSDPKPLRAARIKGKSAEHSFDIEIMPNVVWNGKIDMIGRREGLRWLVEHKSFKRRPNDDARWRNLQSVSYFRAMDMLGWPAVDGTCWDYIWSKPPMIPGLLQDGTMSRKSIDTMPSAVLEGVRQHNMQLRDYKAFVEATRAHRSKWFFRVYTRVDENVKNYIFDEFLKTIEEMVENHGKESGMNPESHCSWCDFEPLCRAKLQGLDYDFIKERQYEKSEGKSDEADHILEYEG